MNITIAIHTQHRTSTRLLQVAEDYCFAFKARLRVLTVIEPQYSGWDSRPILATSNSAFNMRTDITDLNLYETTRVLDQATMHLDKSIRTQIIVRSGYTCEEIIKDCREANPDFLIFGWSRGCLFGDFFGVSKTAKWLRHLQCGLIILTAKAAANRQSFASKPTLLFPDFPGNQMGFTSTPGFQVNDLFEIIRPPSDHANFVGLPKPRQPSDLSMFYTYAHRFPIIIPPTTHS